MSVFWSIVAGFGTAVGLMLGYTFGFERGSAQGYRDGVEYERESVARILALARAELLARDIGGSEFVDIVQALLRETH